MLASCRISSTVGHLHKPDTLKTVFISGPYSSDPELNTSIAIRIWIELYDHGFAGFCPHLSYFCTLHKKLDYDEFMKHCTEWVTRCDYFLRFPGESPGADAEHELAASLGKPVYFSVDQLLAGES